MQARAFNTATTIRAVLAVAVLSLTTACSSSTGSSDKGQGRDPARVADAQALTGVKSSDTGKTIDLPHYVPDFPPGPGHDLFMTRCGVCHSLRYVTMQPDFSRKTWTKEVDKMIQTYGAHITKKEAEQITEYLWTIKGKKDVSTK